MSELVLVNNELILRTPYDPGLVAALKSAVPASDRKWIGARKEWIITPQYGQQVASLVEAYLGEHITVPASPTQQPAITKTILEVRYLGSTKPQPGWDEPVAFGWCDGEWSVIFPESVLRDWFEGLPSTRSMFSTMTLYGVLGIKRNATTDEIKSSYRRLARQWHPDVCREPNAGEMFLQIKSAYELLSSPVRGKYDAGLALEESLGQNKQSNTRGYRAPLRCGLLIAEGIKKLGRFVVSKVEMWEDIRDDRNRTLVTSWRRNAEIFDETWV